MEALRRNKWAARLALCLALFSLSPYGAVLCNGVDGNSPRMQLTYNGICLNCVSEGLDCCGITPDCCADEAVGLSISASRECACAQPPLCNEAVREQALRAAAPSASRTAVVTIAVALPIRAVTVAAPLRPPPEREQSSLAPCHAVLRI